MWWIISSLVYVVGVVVIFRVNYPQVIDTQQRRTNEHGGRGYYSIDRLKTEERQDWLLLALIMMWWPLVLVGYSSYHLARGTGKLTMKLLFPRGIVTKFELEQREQQQRKEYEAAKRALEAEGIKVELEN
jgi:hypothetical protein